MLSFVTCVPVELNLFPHHFSECYECLDCCKLNKTYKQWIETNIFNASTDSVAKVTISQMSCQGNISITVAATMNLMCSGTLSNYKNNFKMVKVGICFWNNSTLYNYSEWSLLFIQHFSKHHVVSFPFQSGWKSWPLHQTLLNQPHIFNDTDIYNTQVKYAGMSDVRI